MEQPPVKKIVKKIVKVIKKVPLKAPVGGAPARVPVSPAGHVPHAPAPSGMIKRPVSPQGQVNPQAKKVIVKKIIKRVMINPAQARPQPTFAPAPQRPQAPVSPPSQPTYYEPEEPEEIQVEDYNEPDEEYYDENEEAGSDSSGGYIDEDDEEYDEDEILAEAIEEDDDDDIDLAEFDEFVKSMEEDYDKVFNDFMAQNFLEDAKDEDGDDKEDDRDYFEQPLEVSREKLATVEKNVLSELKPEELRLFKALKNLEVNIEKVADYNGYEMPEFNVRPIDLYTRLRKKSLRKVRKDIFSAWAMLAEVYKRELGYLTGREGEDELMAIAENAQDGLLKDSIVNYLLVMVEVEACKLRDEAIKLKYEKLQATKEVVEKKRDAKRRKAAFIKKIKSLKLPIDADKLVNNYFKMAKKDPDKAYKLLTTNPAMFAPIDFAKMPKGFLGAKPKPKDGIKMNKKIAMILKSIKA